MQSIKNTTGCKACLTLQSGELHGGRQASDGQVVIRVSTSNNSVLARRNLVGELDCSLQVNNSLLDRALQVDVSSLLAQVKSLLQQADVAVAHIHIDVSALLDDLLHNTLSKDNELGASQRRVGVEGNVEDLDALGFLEVTEHQGRVTRDGFV